MAEINVENPDTPFPGRGFYSVAADSAADLAAAIPATGQHFVLFLAWDASGATDEEILAVARILLSKGLAYLVAWGPDCSRVHDIFDFACVEESSDPSESVVMTTWHDDESLASALWFFLFNTVPDESYETTTNTAFAAAVASTECAVSIRLYLCDKALLDRDAGVYA